MKKIYKDILKIAIPVALQHFILSSNSLLDNAMVSSLGDLAVGAVGAANKFLMMIKMIIVGVGAASGILASQYFAKGDRKGIVKAFGTNIILGLVCSAIFAISYLTNADSIVNGFSPDAGVRLLIKEYLSVGIFESFAFVFILSFMTSMRSTGKVSFPFYNTLMSLVVNGILNFLLIGGNFGFPALGVRGAAIATLISEVLAVVVLSIGAIVQKHVMIDTIKETFAIPFSFIKKYLQIGGPIIASNFLWTLSLVYLHKMFGQMGVFELSAYGVLAPIEQLFIHLFIGLAQATIVIVGGELGRKNFNDAYSKAKNIYVVGIVAGTVLGSIIFILSGPISRLYYNLDPKAISYVESMLKVYGLFLGIRIFNLISFGGTFRSGGDSIFLFVVGTFSGWFVTVPAVYAAMDIYHMGVQNIYWIANSAEIFLSLIFVWRFRSKKWMRNLTG